MYKGYKSKSNGQDSVRDDNNYFVQGVGALQEACGEHLPNAVEQIGFAFSSIVKPLEHLVERSYESRLATLGTGLVSWSEETTKWGATMQRTYSGKSQIKLDDIRKGADLVVEGYRHVHAGERSRLDDASTKFHSLLGRVAESRARAC